jgi:trimeric autotransporter adhesin
MRIHHSLGLLWVALFYAAPATADSIFPPAPSVAVSSATERGGAALSASDSIRHLSEVAIAPRTLAESGISGRAIAPSATAQATAPNTETISAETIGTETISAETISADNPPQPTFRVAPQIGTRFTTQGAGTDTIVGFEGFVPIAQRSGQNLTYAEGRLQISTENGTLGSNALLGHRFLTKSQQQIIGGYLAYDHRNTGDASFNQLGAGVEYLSDKFDVRANAYLPLGDRRSAIGTPAISNLSFRANELAIERSQAFQEALPGVDLEIGTKLFNLGETGSVRGYIGGYYYGGNSSFAGFRSRLVARPNNSITTALTLQTDSRFDTRVLFSLGIQLPGSGASRPRSTSSMLTRLGESPERQASILVDDYVKRQVEVAINPTTGRPWKFQFVNLGIGTGNGTFENPAGTLVQVLPTARSGDLVYVNAGTNPGIAEFTIPDGVSVVSTALITSIATQLGFVPLPNGGTGIRPQITGPVTLGNSTRLFGFEISSGPSVGIRGQSIRDIDLADNLIASIGAGGISLVDVTGELRIINNEINQLGSNPASSQAPGIFLQNSTGNTTATIAQNTISNATGSGIAANASGTAEISAKIERNRINQPGFNGIFGVAEGRGNLRFQVINNQVVGTASSLRAGIGVGARGDGNTIAEIIDNQVFGFTNADAEGIRLFAQDNAQITTAIARNTITVNRRGILVTAGTTARVAATIEDNTATGNLEEGILITGGIEQGAVGVGSPQVASILNGNRVADNRVSGIGYGDLAAMSFSAGSRVCLQLANNNIGTLTLADIANPALGAPFNTVPLSLLGGVVSLELPVTLTNFGSNAIAVVSPTTTTLWSRTNRPAESCRLP